MFKNDIINTIKSNKFISNLITYIEESEILNDSNNENNIIESTNFTTIDNKIILTSCNKIFTANIN